MKIFLFTVLLVSLINVQLSVCAFPNFYRKIITKTVTENAGDPLFLTPLIEQNKLSEARAAAKVSFEQFEDVESYSGFLTVNKNYDSNLFLWFFPAKIDYQNAPVLLWLQGGPGATSFFGLLEENGPFVLKSASEVELREYSWSNAHSVIYIDNPVGTGFSFTKGGYARNETQVGKELYIALQQFFTLFPDLQKNDFYITGESYAGKYVPAVSYTILKNNPDAKLKINLQGLAIGNGLSDPEHQLKYSDYLYQIGLIDTNAKQGIFELEQQGVNYIQNKEFYKAFVVFDSLLNGDLTNETTIFRNVTGFSNYYNYLYNREPNSQSYVYMGEFLQRPDVRAAIHVGNLTFNGGDEVETNLENDVMDSVASWISELLSNYRVLLYTGQLDIIVAYPLTLNYLQNLVFNGAEEYKTAPRYQWYVGQDLAGYVKQAGNLTEVLVRNAGHMVPSDQPQWALDLISRFTRNQPLYNI